MANDCCGTMKVVSKSREALERFERIMKYEDPEFFCYRVRDFGAESEIYEQDGMFCREFGYDSAWSSERWFFDEDQPETLIVEEYDKDMNPIYGTAHLTGIPHLAKLLGFGLEMWGTEPGCCFAEHAVCDCKGWNDYDTADYSLGYPDGEDGEPDWDADPIEENGFGDDFGTYCSPSEIYDTGCAAEEE